MASQKIFVFTAYDPVGCMRKVGISSSLSFQRILVATCPTHVSSQDMSTATKHENITWSRARGDFWLMMVE